MKRIMLLMLVPTSLSVWRSWENRSTLNHLHPKRHIKAFREPWVDVHHTNNATARMGHTASLSCKVYHKGNHTVSWIRHQDLHLLTVDRYTYTSDQRFRVLHDTHTQEWILFVTSVQARDEGTYECQVGTNPPKGHFVNLHVIEPVTKILGGADVHINAGSTLNLTCFVMYYAKPPDVTWYRDEMEIDYRSNRGGITIVTESKDLTKSSLLIHKVSTSDYGNYTCNPEEGKSDSVSVHVLSGEHRAAMHSSAEKTKEVRETVFILSFAVILKLLFHL